MNLLALSASLFGVSIGLLGVALCCWRPAAGAAHRATKIAHIDNETATGAETSAMGHPSLDTAPLTGKQPALDEGAPPRWIHPTSVKGGCDRIAPVAATGLHWAPVLDHSAPCPDCAPPAAWEWLQRSWGLFIICWGGCLAILMAFNQIRSAAQAPEPSSLITTLDDLLWTSSCRAGLTCFGLGVLAIVAVLLVLVGLKGARHPWSVPLLMLFSPLEDVNLGIVFGGSSFALEAAVIFFAVLVGIVAWTTYHLSRARKTQEHLGCSWGSVTVLGCAISVICTVAAVAIDVATETNIRYGVHGESLRSVDANDVLSLGGVFVAG